MAFHLIGRRRRRKSYLAVLVANALVELFALKNEEVRARLEDAALDGNGAGRVDVVARHHAHRDTGALAPSDGVGYFGPDRIFDAHDAHARQVVDDVLLVVPIRLVLEAHLIDLRLGRARHKVAVGHGDGAQAVAGHRLDYVAHQTLLVLARELLQLAIGSVDEGAPIVKWHSSSISHMAHQLFITTWPFILLLITSNTS